jgi:hypothetical protein
MGFGSYLLVFQFRKAGTGLVIYFSALALAYVLVGRYKRVCIGDGVIYVSNYLLEIQLAPSEIERVDGPSWKTKTPEIVITLRSQSPFGRTIKFAPKFLLASEIVSELRRMSRRDLDRSR